MKNDYPSLFDKISPDACQESRLGTEVTFCAYRRRRKRRGMILACCTVIVLGGGSAVLAASGGFSGLETTNPSSASVSINETVLDSSHTQTPVEHDFTVCVKLADGSTKELEKEVPVHFGSVKIDRREWQEIEENGVIVKRYPVGVTHYGSAFGIGETDAVRIRFKSTFENMGYMTEALYQFYEKNGDKREGREYTLLSFETDLLPSADSADEDTRLAKLEELWESGVFKEQQESGLASNGLQTGFRDYLYWWRLEDLENGRTKVKINLPRAVFGIYPGYTAYADEWETIDVQKEGRPVNFIWTAYYSAEAAAQYPLIPFEELPGDRITIEATFADGQVVTKVIDISFDSEGKSVIRLK